MPVYNAEKHLHNSIESILRQKLSNFELLIIVDNGSTDDSKKIIESYKDSRIKLIDNEENIGLVKARNKGIAESKGEYIAWLDADDISHSFRLKKQVNLLDKYPDVGICGTWVKTINAKVCYKWRYPTNPDFVRSRFVFDNPLATSSVIIRKKILSESRQIFQMDYAEDYDLWERLSSYCKITNIPMFLTYYRIHENQTSGINNAKLKYFVWKIQERQLKKLDIHWLEEEKQIHQKLGAWDFDASTNFLSLANSWLLKLQKANLKTQCYPDPQFTRVLAERWFFVCRTASVLGFTTWSAYWNSPLRRHNEYYKHVYIFARCLIRLPGLKNVK